MADFSLPATTIAARQYANRPQDERISSVQAFIDQAVNERAHSIERNYNWKDLQAVPNGADNLILQSPKGAAPMTHWAFGQVCRSVGAPAGYLRGLPPELAAECVNHGLAGMPAGSSAALLVRVPNGRDPVVRAATSDTYSRVWDSELASVLQSQVFAARTSNGAWQNAPTWAGEEIAGFRSDRDSFLFQIDGGSIVTDPSAGDDGRMYRGIIVRNSEVGAASISIEVFLYRFVCGNWNLWGAVLGSSYRRRHVGAGLTRDVVREIAKIGREFTQRPASADDALIRLLIGREIAHSKEAVIDELRAIGLTASQAADAYTRCEQMESASPRSFWGIAQGITRLSQDTGYQDERYALDRLAAAVLARGAKVAA